ncbi:hypothetical protein SZ64_04540 [Erythrobacter sp. SG61-1L]|uniref:hypothetical protein n=1 Tax=Erythrobacter sp. SG61-1L TaxID=1603897 RepID=UPI0006C91D89|nr:hypothetical protein [Erythrobacter sp. SG61-1L]KPL67435.1 hypothetical protein SZ64_04540 [Erythrobacter sp. SG61-1L]
MNWPEITFIALGVSFITTALCAAFFAGAKRRAAIDAGEPAGRVAGDIAETAGPGLSDYSFHDAGNSSAGQQDHG